MASSYIAIGIIGLLIFAFWLTGIRIINEYERGVVLRLGRLKSLKGPGLRAIIPFGIDRLIKVDLRTITLEVPPQEAITLDNVTVSVLAVVYFQVINPALAVTRVVNYYNATSQLAQSTLRSVVGQSTLATLLSERDSVSSTMSQILDRQTEPWGVKVTSVEMKDVELPDDMQRAMARQAEAEREKLAKLIHADAEYLAAQKLVQAAEIMESQPSALQLRYLQTLSEIGEDNRTVVVFPMPIDLLQPLIDLKAKPQRLAPTPHPATTITPPALSETDAN